MKNRPSDYAASHSSHPCATIALRIYHPMTVLGPLRVDRLLRTGAADGIGHQRRALKCGGCRRIRLADIADLGAFGGGEELLPVGLGNQRCFIRYMAASHSLYALHVNVRGAL
jgi:hypothetical protein